MVKQFTTLLLQNKISKKLCFVKKEIALFIKKSLLQNFLQLNLKENTKTMTSDSSYLYNVLC